MLSCRALRYVNTSCSVTNVTYAGNSLACSCGKGCKSDYPCLKIVVSLGPDHDLLRSNSTDKRAFIAASEVELHRKVCVHIRVTSFS